MNKKELKKLRLAVVELVKNGAPEKEVFYIKPSIDEVLKYGAGFLHKSTRVVNHYRRMKRLMKRRKITPEAAIQAYSR